MDIKSILSQVLSLSELVIKNPSTSIKGSGFDLSSLTSIAGSLLGGKGGSQQGGGLGSILGAAAATGALNSILGGKGGSQQGGGLGSILGGLASAAAGAASGKKESGSPAGGLGAILGGLTGGTLSREDSKEEQSSGGLGDILGKITSNSNIIKNMLSDSNSQKYSSEQKGNLSDMLNILNTVKSFTA